MYLGALRWSIFYSPSPTLSDGCRTSFVSSPRLLSVLPPWALLSKRWHWCVRDVRSRHWTWQREVKLNSCALLSVNQIWHKSIVSLNPESIDLVWDVNCGLRVQGKDQNLFTARLHRTAAREDEESPCVRTEESFLSRSPEIKPVVRIKSRRLEINAIIWKQNQA